MPDDSRSIEAERFRQGRGYRVVWLAWVITLLVVAVLYANKAAEERSAFIRWRHQVHDFWQGVNIWDKYVFPNPPIMPICLSPLMALPPVVGALLWFAIKASMATVALFWCLRMARGPEGKSFPWWAVGLVLLLSLRTLLSDLTHGNINILILFLVVAMLEAWRRGYDALAGLLLGAAITFKVTPALFLPYFFYKKSWRTVGATFLGLFLCFLVIPSVVLGPEFNRQCLSMWWHRMLSPYVVGDDISPQEMNQSLGGVMTRLLVEHPRAQSAHGYGGVKFPVNVVAWPSEQVTLLVKVLSVGLLGLLGLFCRTRTERRDDARMFGEYALVVLTMLFASERTWKHHYVTLMLPYAYLVYRGLVAPETARRTRVAICSAIALSALLIGSTSREVGRLFGNPEWHDVALSMGMFFWGAVVLYVTIAWRLVADRNGCVDDLMAVRTVPRPHVLEKKPPAARDLSKSRESEV